MNPLTEQFNKDVESFDKKFSIFEQIDADEVEGTFAIQEDAEKVKRYFIQSTLNLTIKIIESVKRVKLDMDVIVCDCGEPYRESDAAVSLSETISQLVEFRNYLLLKLKK